MKIKQWFRKKYIYWKYKHNWNTGKLVILKEEDRHLGLTTMMIKDCFKKNYALLVPTEIHKKNMASEIYKLGQLGVLPTITERDAYEQYLVTPNEIQIGKRIGKPLKVIVDNCCWDWDDIKLLRPYITNGFLHLNIAA